MIGGSRRRSAIGPAQRGDDPRHENHSPEPATNAVITTVRGGRQPLQTGEAEPRATSFGACRESAVKVENEFRMKTNPNK